eukprot:scaffold88481_cov34-Phaeocystis_antarctica.AAC.2
MHVPAEDLGDRHTQLRVKQAHARNQTAMRRSVKPRPLLHTLPVHRAALGGGAQPLARRVVLGRLSTPRLNRLAPPRRILRLGRVTQHGERRAQRPQHSPWSTRFRCGCSRSVASLATTRSHRCAGGQGPCPGRTKSLPGTVLSATGVAPSGVHGSSCALSVLTSARAAARW